MVFEKNDESALDHEEDEPISAGNGRYLQKIDEQDEEKAIEIRWSCSKRGEPRKTLPDGNDRRKQSKRKTKDKVFGWNQDAGWSEKRWRSRPPGRR